jgi:hypothetical protein
MLEVQKYLQNHTLEQLTTEFGVKVKEYEHYIGLNYDQIESPKVNPIVIECRALILERDTLDVAARSYDRFFNYGECPEYYTDFMIERSVIMQKVDGSLMLAWWNAHGNQWELSTRSMIFAEGDHVLGGTFRQHMLKAGAVTEEKFQEVFGNLADKSKTYVLEYIGPSNRIVTRYERDEWVITGIRSADGAYDTIDQINDFARVLSDAGVNVRAIQTYRMNSFSEIVAATKELPALEEGYVVWDTHTGKRIKIKSAAYVAIHHMRGEGALNTKRVLTLVLGNDHEEYLEYYPEDRPVFEPVIKMVADFKESLEAEWAKVMHIEDQKEFALLVKDLRASGVFFTAKKTKQTPTHVFNTMEIQKQLRMFDV